MTKLRRHLKRPIGFRPLWRRHWISSHLVSRLLLGTTGVSLFFFDLSSQCCISPAAVMRIRALSLSGELGLPCARFCGTLMRPVILDALDPVEIIVRPASHWDIFISLSVPCTGIPKYSSDDNVGVMGEPLWVGNYSMRQSRDMEQGWSRSSSIWFKSDFSRKLIQSSNILLVRCSDKLKENPQICSLFYENSKGICAACLRNLQFDSIDNRRGKPLN